MARPTLFNHRKLLRLSRRIGSEAAAVGHLVLLWQSCYESGDPVVGDELDVESVARWQGAHGELVAALLEAGGQDRPGFIEQVEPGIYQVHDFWDHAPSYVQRRAVAEAERKERGETISDIRRAAAAKRWRKDGPDAKGQPFASGDLQFALLGMQTDATHAPAPAPAPAPKPPVTPRERGAGLLDDEDGGTSKWAVKAKRPKGITPRHLEAVVVRCLREIRQEEVRPDRCATAAGSIISLWRVVGHPDLDVFADELVLVARAAQMCGERIFSRDIRAEGWPEGTDRTFSVETICRHAKWDDRLRVARRWAQQTGRIDADGVARARRRRWLDPHDSSSWTVHDEPEPMIRAYHGAARALMEAELGGDGLRDALGRLESLGALSGASPDLTRVVRLALDEVGRW